MLLGHWGTTPGQNFIYVHLNRIIKQYDLNMIYVSDPSTHHEHLALLEEWMRSYRSEELFDANGRLKPELAELAPKGERRMGANPHANGGLLLRDLKIPDFRDYGTDTPSPGIRGIGDTKRRERSPLPLI